VVFRVYVYLPEGKWWISQKKQMGIEPDQQRYEDSMPSVPLSWVKNQDSPTEFVYIVIVPNSYILGFNGI